MGNSQSFSTKYNVPVTGGEPVAALASAASASAASASRLSRLGGSLSPLRTPRALAASGDTTATTSPRLTTQKTFGERPSESATYRASSHPSEFVATLTDFNYENAWELFQVACRKYPHRACLGRRFRNDAGELGPYEWITYAETRGIAMSFGTTLIREDITPLTTFPDEQNAAASSMRLLGLFSKNCVEWLLAEHACNAYGVALVPLYDTLGADAMEYILKQTQVQSILVSFECLKVLLTVLTKVKERDGASGATGGTGATGATGGIAGVLGADGKPLGPEEVLMSKQRVNVNCVILVDPKNPKSRLSVQTEHEEAMSLCAQLNIRVLMWHEVCSRGKPYLEPTPEKGEKINTLCYTSGTTGYPKGVLITNANVVSLVCAAIRGPVSTQGYYVGPSDVYISYLPLAHVLERLVTNVVAAVGGSIGVYSGDVQHLLEDIKELAPTVFVTVPRLLFRINDRISASLLDKSGAAQMLFNQGLNSKLSRYRVDATKTHKLWDALVFNKIKQLMGGRLKGIISGGAPLDPIVQEKMMCFFSVPILQGYGLTESFGPAFLMHPSDPASGHIGGLFPSCEFKLVSVPEMSYFVDADPPKGELCLRGPSIAAGYFRNEAETQSAFEADGWFHTGDIAAIVGTSNAVKIIDRKKNIFKLAQGEYIAPEKIENVYCQAMSVSQCFVFGYSTKMSIVAIIVPDPEMAMRWALKNGMGDKNVEALCLLPELKEYVFQDMQCVADRIGLAGFEKVRAIHLSPEEFTVENGLLTPTIKIKRAQATQRYTPEIDALYESLGQ